jgi:hypothetical protein
MKTVKAGYVIGLTGLLFAGSVWADQANVQQNIARRAVVVQAVSVKADQAWEGASLQSNAAQQQAGRPSGLQYISRRSTL